MKKRMALLLALLLALGLSACAKAEDKVVDILAAGFEAEKPGSLSSGETQERGAPNGEWPDGETMRAGAPEGEKREGEKQGSDFSGGAASAEAASTVVGRVDSIVGNEVTLALGEYSDAHEFTENGESATYLLPVGMSIGSGDFTSVSAGAVLTLSLNEAEEVIAASLRG